MKKILLHFGNNDSIARQLQAKKLKYNPNVISRIDRELKTAAKRLAKGNINQENYQQITNILFHRIWNHVDQLNP
jgi:hypothetical protein